MYDNFSGNLHQCYDLVLQLAHLFVGWNNSVNFGSCGAIPDCAYFIAQFLYVRYLKVFVQ